MQVVYEKQKKYQKSNIKWVSLPLNKNTDQDIIEYLEKQENKRAYIKALIRENMKKS